MRPHILSLTASLPIFSIACGTADPGARPSQQSSLAIVWRAGCSACNISTEEDPPDRAVLDEQEHRIAVQPVTIDGELEDGFRVVFPASPPAFVGSDTYYEAPTGMLVLAEATDTVTFRRAHDVTFDYTFLFDDERALAGVTAVTPYYVAFANRAGRLNDEFTGTNQNLNTGYHVARHDPALLRQWTASLMCANYGVTHPTLGCPSSVFAYQQAEALAATTELAFVPGSEDDLIDVLAGIDVTTLEQ